MLQRLASAVLKRGAELALSLGLVLTGFLAILVVGTLVFPEGRGLRTLLRERGTASATDLDGVTRKLRLSGSEARQAEIARLERVERKVKDKPATNIAWTDARPGMALGERHSIQTFDRSSATIAFDSATQLELAANSLVVLRSFDRREDGSDRRATLVLSGGEVRGRVRSPSRDAIGIDVELPRGRARFRPDAKGDEAAQFRIEVDEEAGESRVSVFSGEAEITSGEEKVRVEARQSVRIDPSGAVPRPIVLPDSPRLRSPRSERISFRNEPPPVTFAWEAVPGAESYVVRIATDPDFREIVFRTETGGTELEHGTLPAGRYSWQVSTVADGLEGPPSASGRITLRSDREPPSLAVDWPTGTVAGSWVEIRGTTEPGARVFAANERVPVDEEGRFTHRVPLVRGANVVVVEAFDEVGNTAYESHIVNAEHGGGTAP